MDQHPQERPQAQPSVAPTTPVQPQQSEQGASPAPQSSQNSGGSLTPNVAAALSYVLGWVTGIVFFLISKDKFVKFHAMQSIVASVAAMVINYILGSVLRMYSLSSLFSLLVFALFIFLIVQAYQKNRYKLPVLGDLAEQWSGGGGVENK